MNISVPGVKKCTIIAHKYAIKIEHSDIKDPFKIVVKELINENTGESLGWYATPEIQLRQTTQNKQEYIMSNTNPTKEGAIEECIRKMAITPKKEIFYKDKYDENFNKLW